jgi:trehalose 6-phosphate synthase
MHAPAAPPVYVVSNRLPYDRPRAGSRVAGKRNVGGLVNAVEPVVARRGGRWIGWDGTMVSSAAKVASSLESSEPYDSPTGVRLHGIPLSERDVALYYHGLSNRALWPLFHDFPGKAVFRSEDWRAYERVNRRFVEVLARLVEPPARVWVHDYHLMLVPRLLREAGFGGRIDFFLHIPFPPAEIFRALPWRDEVMRGLLSADTVGFHVPLYRDNFVGAARALTGATAESAQDGDAIVFDGKRSTRALAAPIGIDVEAFEEVARRPQVQALARRLRALHGDRRILFGADRLDYTKGIRERLQSTEWLLAQRADLAGKIVLVQIVVPSRHQVAEYRQMRGEIEREVGRINGERAMSGWTPIQYRFVGLSREDLVAHYLAADVALVTPLRDGMNLVASEFAASRVDGDGVLVVSEFAGVAERAPGALRVNPYDVEGTARAVLSALDMDASERRSRMTTLRRHVAANPVERWATTCLDAAAPTDVAGPSVATFPASGTRPRVVDH